MRRRRIDRPVVVVGAGHAGLATSYCLKQRGIDHIVLERDRVGQDWRDARWASFRTVTPNWQCRLPGFPYAGADPDGFMSRDEVVAHLEAYAASFGPPLLEGVEVTELRHDAGGGFELATTAGECTAGQVVIATGGHHVARIPRFAERLPSAIEQVSSADYADPDDLPEGDVLVVGSGQSGCQIAEELHRAARTVHLCVGEAPRMPRSYRGREVAAWLEELDYDDAPVRRHRLGEDGRRAADPYVTGRDGGRDVDLRRLAREGMRLYGRLVDIEDGVAMLAPDLTRNLDAADAAADAIRDRIDGHVAARGIEAPPEPRTSAAWVPGVQPRMLDIEAAGIQSVVWCTGFDTDHRWVGAPIFDGRGRPSHERGVTDVPGLYVVGLPWLHTRSSGGFAGIARDAEHLAGLIEVGDRRATVTQLPRPAFGR
ncbi:MAG: putative flavoprotein involved in transport [Solirubrobacteraceae bacterium]|nr:putative flavoprotein involved in transport [Solirubrobacteraceae bacterium]